ncbi:Prephenate dehydratase-domain-containing protein [Podospora appendiculata]|uniref:prephenate dehydratase n=1 Tax=Podospora appendiculata TaxID=314037 RepID=A0AAE0XES1_9PEZI|nr:Prephenate dehydratase-domain-containing protein [Podospora appendiculata]
MELPAVTNRDGAREASAAPVPVPVPVAFLGPLSSYSHQATKSAFSGPGWDLTPTETIKEVFEAVQAGAAVYGVVPFENSTHGTVTFTLDGLADRAGRCADIAVCAEVYLDVHHCLLGHRRGGPPLSPAVTRATPLAGLAHIRRVYSHPQALGQSAAFLATYLRGVELVDVSSTSRAAELTAADESGTSAAVASELAAEAMGLEVLARSIEDREDNTTRFFVLCKGVREGSGKAVGEGKEGNEGGNGYKSLVSFTVPHRTPGALADVLHCFKEAGLNLTSINSLPSLVQPFHYLFFVEFEGCRFDDPQGRVQRAVEDVGRIAQRWRWLGSWRNQWRGKGGE